MGGIPDVVRDGREALLVPSEDPAALARAVQGTLARPETARERVAAAMDRLEKFAVHAWLDRHERVYGRAIGGEAG